MDFIKSIRVVNYSNQIDLMKISSDTIKYTEQSLDCQDDIEVQFDYADVKKQKLEYLIGHPAPECYGFKLEIVPQFGSELLTLNNFLDQILRSSTWLVGRFSYYLMRIKKVEKESDEEKNYKALLQAKIFSGGFQDRQIQHFSRKTIKKLQELSFITQDDSINKSFSHDGVCIDEIKYAASPDEEVLISILHYKRDINVDKFIELI